MTESSPASFSESMQMYIVTLSRLGGDQTPVPLSKLAEEFSISPVSVNEMCRKLQENGLVQYQPYKGAQLTPDGIQKAAYINRRHGLWEVFLVKKLGMTEDQAHQSACLLEHATPDELAERLAIFLEHPQFTPSGSPIPASNYAIKHEVNLTLDQLTTGQVAKVSHLPVDENTALFFRQCGIYAGARLQVLARSGLGLMLEIDHQQNLSLTHDLAKQIFVSTDQLAPASCHQAEPAGNQQRKKMGGLDMENHINQSENQNDPKRVTLNQLRVGQRGIVIRIGAKGQTRQRMMAMGLVPGSEIEVVRVAPLGDPVEFTVKGYHLSLRKNESAEVEVEVVE